MRSLVQKLQPHEKCQFSNCYGYKKNINYGISIVKNFIVNSMLQINVYLQKNSSLYTCNTALRKPNRTVFEEMTSWRVLSWHIGMKTAFQNKDMKSKYFGSSIIEI